MEFTAEKIKELRKNLHYTQQEMADSLSVSLRTYQNWEKGDFKPYKKTQRELELLSNKVSQSGNTNILLNQHNIKTNNVKVAENSDLLKQKDMLIKQLQDETIFLREEIKYLREQNKLLINSLTKQ